MPNSWTIKLHRGKLADAFKPIPKKGNSLKACGMRSKWIYIHTLHVCIYIYVCVRYNNETYMNHSNHIQGRNAKQHLLKSKAKTQRTISTKPEFQVSDTRLPSQTCASAANSEPKVDI